MGVVITQWALDSFLNIQLSQPMQGIDCWAFIMPDVLLLKHYPSNPKFDDQQFWSNATYNREHIMDGHEMKWTQIHNHDIQLKLLVVIFDGVYIDSASVGHDQKFEKRRLAVFKTHVQLIRQGRYIECGVLT